MPGIEPRSLPKGAVRNLRGYEEEAHGGINLSNNANLFGANPALAKALAAVKAEELWDYPSLASHDLRGAIGDRLKFPASGIIVGNGSNDLIDVTIRTFAEPGDAVAYHPPTFAMIPIFARTNDADPRPAPLGANFDVDVEAVLGTNARVTFLVSPNNPTGNAFSKSDILAIVERAKGIVVVDEAYIQFGGESVVSEIPNNPNLVVLRTMSKAYGLAGLRVGFLLAQDHAAQAVAKVRGPFRLNAVSERAARLAISEDAWLAEVVRETKAQRSILADALRERGFLVHPSDANFLLAQVPPGWDGPALASELAKRGVWIREYSGDFSKHVRITIGPAHLMREFLGALDAVLHAKGGRA
jgi:histidinol-phosphate aminotransferase